MSPSYIFLGGMTMKKKFVSIFTAIVMLFAFSVSAYAEGSSDDAPESTAKYLYTNSISSVLSISGHTATCKSKVVGAPSMVTKIEITQSLEIQFAGWWYRLQSWSKTFYDWVAIYTTTGTASESGTYHLRTVAKVYSGSNYETVSMYSHNVTI